MYYCRNAVLHIEYLTSKLFLMGGVVKTRVGWSRLGWGGLDLVSAITPASAKQFWVFSKRFRVKIFSKNTKTVLLISQQPNIAQRPFCIKKKQQDILYHLI